MDSSHDAKSDETDHSEGCHNDNFGWWSQRRQAIVMITIDCSFVNVFVDSCAVEKFSKSETNDKTCLWKLDPSKLLHIDRNDISMQAVTKTPPNYESFALE